jgi:hypothetical protein
MLQPEVVVAATTAGVAVFPQQVVSMQENNPWTIFRVFQLSEICKVF